LLTLRHVRLPVQRLKRVLIAGLFLVVTWRLILTLLGASQHRLYFGPDMSCDCLIVGCIAGLWFATNSIPSVFRNPLSRRALAAAALVAMSATMLFTQGWGDRSLFAGTLTVFAIASGILTLCCTLEPAGLLGRSLQVQPLVFTGRISYSLYLWHPLILTQSRLAPIPAVVASFAIATASYYGIERPFLRRKRSERSRLLTSFADRVPETSKSIDLPPGALAAGSART
jgi:peptidoglycan/LPS O-acetylase OafA/YrhL